MLKKTNSYATGAYSNDLNYLGPRNLKPNPVSTLNMSAPGLASPESPRFLENFGRPKLVIFMTGKCDSVQLFGSAWGPPLSWPIFGSALAPNPKPQSAISSASALAPNSKPQSAISSASQAWLTPTLRVPFLPPPVGCLGRRRPRATGQWPVADGKGQSICGMFGSSSANGQRQKAEGRRPKAELRGHGRGPREWAWTRSRRVVVGSWVGGKDRPRALAATW